MATGFVSSFDDPRGLGTIECDTGSQIVFHCASIRDGSRTIRVGESVRFDVVPGHRGAWEAVEIEPWHHTSVTMSGS